jgi:hypothetical protein
VWVDDGPISNRVGTTARTRRKAVGDRVNREVSTCEVSLNARQEGDLIRATGITTAAIGTEGGDLTNHPDARGNADSAESILIRGGREECTQLVRCRFGGEIPIGRHSPCNHIANSTADNIGAKSCGSKCAKQISNVARDGGANRRRWRHAPLAAALSEMKRKSRHAE